MGRFVDQYTYYINIILCSLDYGTARDIDDDDILGISVFTEI